MRIKSEEQMRIDLSGLDFKGEISEVFSRTSALSENITDKDVLSLEAFNGNKDQMVFVNERLAQYYQYDKKDFNKAILYWFKLIDIDCEERVEALINLTTCFTHVGNYPDAFGSIKFASEINKDKDTQVLIDQIISDLNGKAVTEELLQIRKIDEKIESGDFDGALVECDSLLKLNNSSYTAHFKKGHIYSILGEPGTATAEFLKAR